ncbi:2-C-methyl-D-erythritol 4-phosphate cytidylyltransferase [Acidihalobacter prosperus]
MNSSRCWVVLPAAGAGRRMGGSIPKQYLCIGSYTILEHTLSRFVNRQDIAGIVVALSRDDPYWDKSCFYKHPDIYRVTGGMERPHSVLSALNKLMEIASPYDWVLVHDAARPCLRRSDLDGLIESLYGHDVGGILATPLKDTLKKSDSKSTITQTIDRDGLWLAQTPQMFRLAMLHGALGKALASQQIVTDEASAMELQGYKPLIIEGHSDNIKITRKEDLPIAEFLLKQADQ